jgi:hypothetical protein
MQGDAQKKSGSESPWEKQTMSRSTIQHIDEEPKDDNLNIKREEERTKNNEWYIHPIRKREEHNKHNPRSSQSIDHGSTITY